MTARMPITAAGRERLRGELERLKNTERTAIIAAVAEARAHGDLSENAEYHAAKEKQRQIESRIAELESALSRSQIVVAEGDGRCVFGAFVDLQNGNGANLCYQIVGDIESEISQGRISVSSPVGRALLGKSAGDVAEVRTPRGLMEYEIVRVRYK